MASDYRILPCLAQKEDVKDFDCACASSRTCFQRVFGKSTWSIPISCSPASVPLAVTLHYLHTVTARFGAACSAHPVPIQCPTSAHHSAHHSAQQQIMVFAHFTLLRDETMPCMLYILDADVQQTPLFAVGNCDGHCDGHWLGTGWALDGHCRRHQSGAVTVCK